MNSKELKLQQRLAALAFLCFFGLYGWFTQDITLDFWAEAELFTARTFPQLIAIGGAILSAIYLINPAISQPISIDGRTLLCGLMVLLLIAYGYLVELAGFPIASVLLLAAGFAVLGERRPWLIVIVSVGVVGGLVLILMLLGIHIDPGLLGLLLERDGS